MPDDIAAQFLARLWEIQAAAHLSNTDLASRLDVSQGYISRLRRRKRGSQVTLEFAMRAAREFPELRVFLSFDVSVSNTSVPQSTDAEAEGSGR